MARQKNVEGIEVEIVIEREAKEVDHGIDIEIAIDRIVRGGPLLGHQVKIQ